MGQVNYHYVVRKKSESGQDGTVTYDLPESGFIPEINLRVFSTGTSSTDPVIPASVQITKVELLDGGTVLQSLTGNQLHAVSMFRGNKERASTERNEGGVEGYDDFRILLGANVNGIDYAPDFSRFTNPQIQITWDNTTTTGPFGETYDADTSPAMKFTVLCKIVRGQTKYTHGYVLSKQIKTFTSAASATVQTDVPRGEALLGLMVEAGYIDLDWTEDVEQIKLDFDNGAWVPFDFKEEEIVPAQREWFGGPFTVSWQADLIDAVETDLHIGYVTDVKALPVQASAREVHARWNHNFLGVSDFFIEDSDGASFTTYLRWAVTSKGYMPYQCWYCPMSALLNGEGDLVDTTQFGQIILEIVQGASVNTSSTPAVIAEYLVTR